MTCVCCLCRYHTATTASCLLRIKTVTIVSKTLCRCSTPVNGIKFPQQFLFLGNQCSNKLVRLNVVDSRVGFDLLHTISCSKITTKNTLSFRFNQTSFLVTLPSLVTRTAQNRTFGITGICCLQTRFLSCCPTDSIKPPKKLNPLMPIRDHQLDLILLLHSPTEYPLY